MTTQLAPLTKQQFFDNSGVALASGKVYTYAAGTLTPLTTYTDASGTTANTNPVLLDAAGRASIWLNAVAFYKFVVQDSAGNTIYTTDNVTVANGGINTTTAVVVNVPDGEHDAFIINRVTNSQNPVLIRTGSDLSRLSIQTGITPANETSLTLTSNNGTAAANSASLSIGGTNFFNLDSVGNIGLNGAAATAWNGPGNIQSNNFVWSGLDSSLGYNYQYTSTGYQSIITGAASKYAPISGKHMWYTAPSVGALSALSFSKVMSLNTDGSLNIGQDNGGLFDSNSLSLQPVNSLVINHATGTATPAPFASFGYAGSSIGSITQFTNTAIGLQNVANITFSDGTQQGTAGGLLNDYRNKIINGNMNVNQIASNAMSNITNNGSMSVAFGIDRWRSTVSNGAGSIGSATATGIQVSFPTGQTDVPGDSTFYAQFTPCTNASITPTSTGAYAAVEQRIEDVRTLAGQTITVSFYAQGSTARTIGVIVCQNFGGGGSANVSVGRTQAITTSWAKYTMTFTLPSILGKSVNPNSYLSLVFVNAKADNTVWNDSLGVINSGNTIITANQYINLAQVQLEPGSAATPFEFRPLGLETTLCQRYLPVVQPGGSNTEAVGAGMFVTQYNGEIFVRFQTMARTRPAGVYSAANGIALYYTNNTTTLQSQTSTSIGLGTTGLFGSEILVGVTTAITSVGMSCYARGVTTAPIYFTGCEL